MKKSVSSALIIAVMFFVVFTLTATAAAQSVSSSLGVATYPAKGQSPDQQNRDEGDCYAWAKKQTGIDPAAAANAPTTQSGPATGGRERVRGAARGAAAGAAAGAIAGDAGKGAAAGAAVGTVAGGSQARRNRVAQQQQAEDAKAGTLQTFNRSFGACMEGRGYSVK